MQGYYHCKDLIAIVSGGGIADGVGNYDGVASDIAIAIFKQRKLPSNKNSR